MSRSIANEEGCNGMTLNDTDADLASLIIADTFVGWLPLQTNSWQNC